MEVHGTDLIPIVEIQEDDTAASEKWHTVNTYMISAKIAFFLDGARMEIDQFFLLFITSVGFNAAEGGLIAGLQEIGGIIGAPVWGYVADKFRIHRKLVLGLCLMACITTCILPTLGISYGNKYTFRCHFQRNISHVKYNSLQSSGHQKLFYSFLFIGILIKSLDASVTSFVDSGVLSRIKTSPKVANYGGQRWMLSLGFGFGGFAYSFVINYYPHSEVTSCETGIFFIYGGLSVLLTISCYYLFKFDMGDTNEGSAPMNTEIYAIIKRTLLNFETIFFFLTALVSGIIRSFYLKFIFLRLKELQAPPLIYGLLIFVVAITGAIFSIISSKVIEYVGGTYNAMCITWFFWAMRFLSFSFLKNPYFVCLIELLNTFSSCLFINTAFTHVCEISDIRILSFMSGKLNALYRQLGSVIGYMVGGALYHIYGAKLLFISAAVVCVIWGVLMLCYIIYNRLCVMNIDEVHVIEVSDIAVVHQTSNI